MFGPMAWRISAAAAVHKDQAMGSKHLLSNGLAGVRTPVRPALLERTFPWTGRLIVWP